ncbi:MAG: Stress responsive Barrel Domain [Gammaproteobacteria bacterium]|jgi:heme-degrading monooxygenase HmoA|nr:Stress responsive Barrel Domain [Gammaproteobacteria bacterium]
MIRHIVILHFKKEYHKDYFKLLESTRPLLSQIPGIVRYNIFENESKYTPEHIYSLGAEIIFKNENALENFMSHPKHYEANSIFEAYLAEPGYMVLTHKIADIDT